MMLHSLKSPLVPVRILKARVVAARAARGASSDIQVAAGETWKFTLARKSGDAPISKLEGRALRFQKVASWTSTATGAEVVVRFKQDAIIDPKRPMKIIFGSPFTITQATKL